MSKLEHIADRAFPDIADGAIAAVEAQYQPRSLTSGQMVTRMAPSPTGFVHLGAVYMGLINHILARQSQGVSILRIEDTDQKRQLENGMELIMSAFETFGIRFDESPAAGGDYGPYVQSERKHIYQAYAKELLKQGKAYLCFSTPAELEQIRETQMLRKERTGYYGAYAASRFLGEDEVLAKLDQGMPFVVRMKSNGSHDKRSDVKDLVRGTRSLPQNDIDPVIIKADDGLPTYHFAHVIDDHLMGTTHVVRGDEWFSSLPLHLEMFFNMGWKPPKYAHLSPIQKMEDTAKRKLSKRKDPEANIEYFIEQGYPVDAIIEYLLNLANSDFEDWRVKNPAAPVTAFELDLKKTSPSGALFDIKKLESISRRVISEYTNTAVYDQAVAWALQYDPALHKRMTTAEEYLKSILNIERETSRKRKDIVRWGTLADDISYFFDDLFTTPDMAALPFDAAVKTACLQSFVALIDPADDRDTWWDKVRAAAESNNFATDMKAFKANRAAYNGSIADFMKIVRFAMTGRVDSPDVFEIMHVLGLDKTRARLSAA